MKPETQNPKSRPLLTLFIIVAIFLTLLHLGMIAVWQPVTIVLPLPWLIPMLNTIMIVIGFSVGFLALIRYHVLRDPVSYWTGVGFAAFSVGFIFYLLAWPGLLPTGEAVIGHVESAAAWVSLPMTSLLAGCLLAADFLRWPDGTALAGPRWLGSLLFILFLVVTGGVLATVVFDRSLPVLVETDGAFTPLALAWGFGVCVLYALGAVLSARRYVRTGDTLPGYVSFTQLFLCFAVLMAVWGQNRYSVLFFFDRFVVIGGFLIMQFGLLSEYFRLFECEREKSRVLEEGASALRQSQELLKRANAELEERVAQRTRHLEEQRAELEQRNQELRETYGQLKEESGKTIQALEEVQERDRMLIQQNRLAAMGELIKNIAHQWRQPLNILALIIQEQAVQHRDREHGGDDFAANTKKAMEVITALSRTIDNFGSFFQSDNERRPFRVNEVLTKVSAMIGESLEELHVSVDVTDQEVLVIEGYRNEFSQVLLNILLNARDAFLEHKVAEPRLAIRMTREGERGVLTITDNAGGIPDAIIDRIFDPYFTTKADKGAGIGLYMAKTLIEKRMNGSLTVRNVDGGAEFRIEV